jgi:hypothetical protein
VAEGFLVVVLQRGLDVRVVDVNVDVPCHVEVVYKSIGGRFWFFLWFLLNPSIFRQSSRSVRVCRFGTRRTGCSMLSCRTRSSYI